MGRRQHSPWSGLLDGLVADHRVRCDAGRWGVARGGHSPAEVQVRRVRPGAGCRSAGTASREVVGGIWGLSQGLLLTGLILISQGRHDVAARLFGAGEALRDIAGTGQFPFVVQWVTEAKAILERELGPDRMHDEWRVGNAMEPTRAIALTWELLD